MLNQQILLCTKFWPFWSSSVVVLSYFLEFFLVAACYLVSKPAGRLVKEQIDWTLKKGEKIDCFSIQKKKNLKPNFYIKIQHVFGYRTWDKNILLFSKWVQSSYCLRLHSLNMTF